MKKILLISNHVMNYRVSVYNYFKERFSSYGYDFIVRADEVQKESPYPINFDFKEILFRFGSYIDEIKRIKPDFVILFLHLKDRIAFPLLYWLKMKKIPSIFWTKGGNLDSSHNFFKNALFHHAQNLSDGIILYSGHELPFVKKKNHYKVTQANNTINYLNYPNIQDSKSEIKKEMNINFRRLALFTGRMDIGRGRKRVDHAIQIFNMIDNPDFGLVLVGSGLSEELKMKLNRRNTVYLGEVYDPQDVRISKIFKMSDVFVMPGHVGLSINQAFFWGLPIVTEEGNQPPEFHYLINGRNGYIVKENDIDELKEKVVQLLENEEECNRLGEHARNDILANASIDNMFKGFFENIKLREKEFGCLN